MKIITVNEKNIDQEHICCALGRDKQNIGRAQSKKDWMKERFTEGLVFKRFDERGKLFIEYMPIEQAWKPIFGKNYLVINCLWVAGKFKGSGLGRQLLDECIKDAQAQKKDGIAVITSTKVKGFLTDKNFFLRHGFQTADTAPPYFELMVLKFNKDADSPVFSTMAKAGRCANEEGFTLIYSNQCPFTEEYMGFMAEVLKNKKIPYEVIKLDNYEKAQRMGSPFGTVGVFYNGKLINHELMPNKKFERFVNEIID